jgi:hypothetical protein
MEDIERDIETYVEKVEYEVFSEFFTKYADIEDEED